MIPNEVTKISPNSMVSSLRWLAEIDDTNWHYVDNAWIVDQLLNLRKNEDQSIDTKGPHYEDQWWIGALSTVSVIAAFCFEKGKVTIHKYYILGPSY